MLGTLRLGPVRILALLLLAAMPLACAGAHEEPPAPPPPPIDPAAFSGPARTPAPEVDLRADLDGGDLWADAASASAPAAPDAGTDAQAPKRKH